MSNNYKDEAIKKLKDDRFEGKYKMVTDAVRDALISFCEQDEEFAQAIVQSDKGLRECIDAVLKKHGSCISDLEVYRKAVEFYFPGATVKMQLTVQVNPYENADKEEKTASVIELDLDDLI